MSTDKSDPISAKPKIVPANGKLVRKELEKRFKQLKTSYWKNFARSMSQLEPQGYIMDRQGNKWMVLEGESETFYLGDACSEKEIEAAFAGINFSVPQELREFYSVFGELRNSPPGEAGHFSLPRSTLSMDDIGERAPSELIKQWIGSSFAFFILPNGDSMLLNRKGEVGMLSHENSSLELMGSFEIFLDSFSKPS